VGAAANGTFLQTGGALGVAVIGSLLNTRYTSDMSAALAPYQAPNAVSQAIRGSPGGALEVASGSPSRAPAASISPRPE
ncbi:MAG: hypothetical protein ACREFO_19640, partial [Acetobacteraceae bacterium]